MVTQDYASHRHGDARLDGYVTLPAGGVTKQTGLLLPIHGWGNDGRIAYETDSLDFADRFDLAVTRVEYRDSGREAHHPEPGATFDRPYDLSKLQTIDCLRAVGATLERYPVLDRGRLLLWGGSQGAHIAAQCPVFAPSAWAGAVSCCGLYHPYTHEQQRAGGYHYDLQGYPGCGFVEYVLGTGQRYAAQHEVDIRSPRRNAALMPDGVPIVLIHGTRDDNVDIRHAVELYARLLACGKEASFYAIANGDHSITGAEAEDERTRAAATIKHAGRVLQAARCPDAARWPATPTIIPVTGGHYEVRFGERGATLRHISQGRDGDAEA